jgi:hypothetical protein
MIVEPDFLNHWKTQMLIVELDDKAAPLYVIALWAHCQTRRKDTFETLPPNALKAICRYEGDSERLRSALVNAGFIRKERGGFVVHGWAESNAKLLANWENGKRGGRPSKTPQKEEEKPGPETHEKPTDNPQVSDKSRVEKSRVDSEREREEETREANGKHPTEEDVIRYARTLMPPADELLARQWWNEMEGSGWFDRQKRPIHISRWKQAFSSAHYGARRVGHEIEARSRNGKPQPAKRRDPMI